MNPSDPESASSSSELSSARLMLWVGTLALLVRFAYFSEYMSSAFFGVPILDEAFYDAVGRALAAGQSIADLNPAFRPMLYPALLAMLYKIAPTWGFAAAILIQHLMGIATTVLVADLARRLYRSSTAGLCAGILYALAGPPLYFESQLLNTALFTFLVTLFLNLPTVERLSSGGAIKIWGVAGLVLGLAAQARPNVLPALLIGLPMMLWNPWKAGLSRRLSAAASMVLGTLAVLVLAGLWHSHYFGQFHLLPTSGGVNFYLGNKDGADGMIPRQDRHTAYGDGYRDSVQVFSEQVYMEETGQTPPLAPSAVSRFWYRKTLDEVLSGPLRTLGLMGRKALLLLWNHEIPNNKSFQFMATQESRLLGLLPVRFAGLLALALLGSWAAWRRGNRPRLVWLLLFIGAYAGGILLFFVNARYRIPLWPVLAVLAGGGLAAILGTLAATVGRFRRSDGPPTGVTTGQFQVPAIAWVLAAALGLASSINWLGVEPETPYRDYFFRSIAHQHQGDLEAARTDALQSVDLAPDDAAANFQLGTLSLSLDDLETAERHLSIATRLLPTEPRVLNNLGIVLERRQDYSRAFLAYVRATELGPNFSAAWVNLALLELRAGEVRRAEGKIRHAEALGDRSVPLQCARAFLEIKRGRIEVGRAILAGAMKRDQELTQRLVDEHRKPLSLERQTRQQPKDRGPT